MLILEKAAGELAPEDHDLRQLVQVGLSCQHPVFDTKIWLQLK